MLRVAAQLPESPPNPHPDSSWFFFPCGVEVTRRMGWSGSHGLDVVSCPPFLSPATHRGWTRSLGLRLLRAGPGLPLCPSPGAVSSCPSACHRVDRAPSVLKPPCLRPLPSSSLATSALQGQPRSRALELPSHPPLPPDLPRRTSPSSTGQTPAPVPVCIGFQNNKLAPSILCGGQFIY